VAKTQKKSPKKSRLVDDLLDKEYNKSLKKAAAHVVDMVDQASTGGFLAQTHYGRVLLDAVRDLRKIVNTPKKVTILTQKQFDTP
jgi:hypothetical protein